MNIKYYNFVVIYLFLSGIFIMSGCNLKRNSTIYDPVVEKNETDGLLEISKIVFSDTATVFYFDAYHCANQGCWFRIGQEVALQGSNQTYKVTACDGIELDAETHVNEAGHLAFVLYFEPVGKSEKTVDYHDGYRNINGIKLFKTPKQQHTGTIICTLKGEIIDRPQSSRLMLIKDGENLRFTQGISIPIRNGKFDYELHCEHEELYQLIFWDEHIKSEWRPVKFISEKGIINFKLHPADQFDKNLIEGGKLNREFLDFNIEELNKFESITNDIDARFNQLEKDGKYNTPEAQSLLDRMHASDNEAEKRILTEQFIKLRDEGFHITQYVKAVQNSSDSLDLVKYQWRLQYSKEHVNIVGYGILVSTIKNIVSQFETDIQPFMEVYNTIYAPAYPDHPYTAKMVNLITGSSLRAGIPFIDFTAIDMDGKQVRLSERIAGKPTLLHLWASWCGPCRKDGIALIPVYEKFHDKGFVVIGVARETSISSAEAAIKSDKYPWENLIELNDAEHIWVKYGIGNAAGSDFFIDENGIIVAIAPSVEDVIKFLENNK